MFKRFIEWLKGLFKKFVFDTGLFEKGLDKVIEQILTEGIKASDNFKDWMLVLANALKSEFGNIKPINKLIDELVESLNENWGSLIDKTKGGIKKKLEVVKEKIIEFVELKLA